MTPEQWQKIQSILTNAGEQPDALAYIQGQANGEGPEFLAELMACYAAMDEEDKGSVFKDRFAEAPPLPETIGPYTISEQIGEGGMGAVYLATQPETKRQVAVKVIRAGWQSPLMVKRFLVEYLALAKLNHPNIASIIEAGTTADHLQWFSMEYAPGLPIDRYCRKKTPDLKDRIALFLQVVSAVSHAHAKAIIHRDIKPSNVLVIETDDGPTVKLIDFGIALPLNPEDDRVTQTHQVIGTPAYMSPEQITNPLGIDTRADVYALGALLFVMLTERTPFAHASEVLTAVREEDPPFPSVVMPAAGTIPPAHVAGDLDAIIMQTMIKDPAERYQSARELAADLENWQTGQPVKAVKQTGWYKARKFVRRNKMAVSSAAVVLLTILAALAVSIHQTLEAQRQAQRAETVKTFLTDTYGAASPFEGNKDMTVIEAMDQAAGDVNTRFADDPEIQAHIHQALADTYHERGALARALHHASELKRIAPTKAHSIRADLLTAQIYREQEKHPEAEALCLAILERTREGSPEWLEAQLYRAQAIREQTRLEEAAALYAEIIPRLKAEFGDGKLTTNALRGLAVTKMQQAKYETALTLFREVLEIQRAVFGSEHPRTLETLNSLANLYRRLGDHRESINALRSVLAIREKVLGEANPNTLRTRINLGLALYRAAHYDEARQFGEETVRLHQQYFGPEVQETIKAQNNLALVYEALGETDQAAQLYQSSFEIRQRTLGKDNPRTLTAAHNLGSFHITLGRYDQAEALLKETWQVRKSVYGPEHIRSLFTCFTLGECYVAMGRYDAALPLLEEAHAGVLKIHEETHEYSVIFAGYLGYVRCRLGKDAALLDFALNHAEGIEPKYKKKLERFAERCERAEQ